MRNITFPSPDLHPRLAPRALASRSVPGDPYPSRATRPGEPSNTATRGQGAGPQHGRQVGALRHDRGDARSGPKQAARHGSTSQRTASRSDARRPARITLQFAVARHPATGVPRCGARHMLGRAFASKVSTGGGADASSGATLPTCGGSRSPPEPAARPRAPLVQPEESAPGRDRDRAARPASPGRGKGSSKAGRALLDRPPATLAPRTRSTMTGPKVSVLAMSPTGRGRRCRA